MYAGTHSVAFTTRFDYFAVKGRTTIHEQKRSSRHDRSGRTVGAGLACAVRQAVNALSINYDYDYDIRSSALH